MGFTLTEVLISLAIFAIGSVAVASIFPSAILIQKRTIGDVNAQVFESSIRGQFFAKGFIDQDLQSGPNGVVFAEEDAVNDSVQVPSMRWPLRARSYGSLSEDVLSRELYWTPLFLDRNLASNPGSGLVERRWSVFAFLVRPSQDTLYPKPATPLAPSLEYAMGSDEPQIPAVSRVRSTGNAFNAATDRTTIRVTNQRSGVLLIRAGDSILDEEGNIHRVIVAATGEIEVPGRISGRGTGGMDLWFADPGTDDRSVYAGLFELVDADGPTSYLVHPD